MNRYVNFIVKIFKTYILRDMFFLSVKKWFKDNGDKTLRLNYPLNEIWLLFCMGKLGVSKIND